jgi:hypothetical protein
MLSEGDWDEVRKESSDGEPFLVFGRRFLGWMRRSGKTVDQHPASSWRSFEVQASLMGTILELTEGDLAAAGMPWCQQGSSLNLDCHCAMIVRVRLAGPPGRRQRCLEGVPIPPRAPPLSPSDSHALRLAATHLGMRHIPGSSWASVTLSRTMSAFGRL